MFGTGLFIVFFSQFLIDLQFLLYGKLHSKIIRHVDIMLTIYFAHGSCFDRLKLHRPFDISNTNYIFSLLKAIKGVVFAIACHHFEKKT